MLWMISLEREARRETRSEERGSPGGLEGKLSHELSGCGSAFAIRQEIGERRVGARFRVAKALGPRGSCVCEERKLTAEDRPHLYTCAHTCCTTTYMYMYMYMYMYNTSAPSPVRTQARHATKSTRAPRPLRRSCAMLPCSHAKSCVPEMHANGIVGSSSFSGAPCRSPACGCMASHRHFTSGVSRAPP